ncbi:ATP-binding protein [bacterium]|nr:ATP-binding protein [bacterium]
MRKIKFTVDSNLEDVALIGTAINHLCLTYFSQEIIDAYSVELCVIEAANNCVKHAYKNEAGNLIEVILAFNTEKLEIEISDYGTSIPKFNNNPTLTFDPNKIETLPEGGMGLFLIFSIMDKVSYTTQKGKNTLTFFKDLKK